MAADVEKALAPTLSDLTKRIREQGRSIDKLTADVEALRKSLELEVHMRSDVGALEREVVKLRVVNGLASWFKKHGPEYRVYDWPMEKGPDLIIEGKGILTAVEVTVRPKMKDVNRLTAGAGIVKLECGRKPDLLVIYSYSGEVPERAAQYATKRGVKIARGPRELKELLNEAAKAGEGTST